MVDGKVTFKPVADLYGLPYTEVDKGVSRKMVGIFL